MSHVIPFPRNATSGTNLVALNESSAAIGETQIARELARERETLVGIANFLELLRDELQRVHNSIAS